jgi:hypothetical protein
MLVRVLLMVAGFAVLYGCGQASSPMERQEERGGVEQAAPQGEGRSKKPPPSSAPTASPEAATGQAVGNMPIAGTIGENVEAGSFDLRVLDYFTADNYYYATDLYMEDEQNVISQAGKFVVVNYSVTNTSPQTISPTPMAQLHARAADNVEVYEQSSEVSPPHRLDPQLALDDIPPRGMLVSQFIFDVPTDVEPELLAVTDEPTIYSSQDVGVVDLREDDPQGPGPEEILALQYEYYNMADYERAYELFAQETKARVSEQAYTSLNLKEDEQGHGFSYTQYSFPSVEIDGDQATIEVVRTFSDANTSEEQDRVTHEAVLEDEGWRIVMRNEQYETYLGG